MSKFLAPSLEIVTVLGLHRILDGTGHGVIDTQDGALHQLDLPGRITTQASASGSLSLAPRLRRRCLTASVGRRHAAGHAKGGRRVLHGVARIGRTIGAVGILVGGRRVSGIGLGQAVPRGRSLRRCASVLRIIEGPVEGTLV